MSLCAKILSVDRRIGFAMVTTPQGVILESRIAGSTLMPQEDIAKFAAIWASLVAGIIQQMEKYFGASEFVSLNYEKLNVHGTILDDRIIVITARKDLSPDIVLRIRALCSMPHS
jgi:hypothetical protein